MKSTRWVADGLKELKDAKQSKRTLNMEGNLHKMPCSETAQELKCGHLLESFSQNDDGQENGQIMENVYVRTRRKAAPMSVEAAEGNATREVPGFSARECTNNSVVEFLHLGYGKHYNLTFEIMNAKRLSSLSAENMSGTSIWDEHLKANSCLRDGFSGNNSASGTIKDGQSSSGEAMNKLLICSKFYTRCKKEDSRPEELKMDTPGEGSAGQSAGPFSPDQTVNSPISDIKQDLGTFFTSHVGPSLVPGAVHRQGCIPDSSH